MSNYIIIRSQTSRQELPPLVVQETLITEKLLKQLTPDVLHQIMRDFAFSVIRHTAAKFAPGIEVVQARDEEPEHDDLTCPVREEHHHIGLAWRFFTEEEMERIKAQA